VEVFMQRLVEMVSWVSALGCALMAGVFFAFSSFVMPGLSRMAPQAGVSAMQAINRAALTRPFLVVFIGTALACAVLGALSVWGIGEVKARYRLAACACYLVGTFLLTAAYHVPRNEALDAVDPNSAQAVTAWLEYVQGWTTWNHVRAAAALAALISLMAAR
jgi:uncharacterized membrane protein